MSTSLAADGLRLRWQLVPNDAPSEIAVFSMYTGKRDEANYPALADEMEDFVESISGAAGGVINGYTVASQLFIDEWQNPLFSSDNWGGLYYRNVTAGVADSAGTVPYQVALVVSRFTDDNELPVKRRRNRSYLGPLGDAYLEPTGLFSSSGQLALGTKLQTFHTALQGVPVSASTPVEYGGLCNASYSGTGALGPAQITNTTEIRIGQVFDTQRRRRNALAEAYEIYPLTVPA